MTITRRLFADMQKQDRAHRIGFQEGFWIGASIGFALSTIATVMVISF